MSTSPVLQKIEEFGDAVFSMRKAYDEQHAALLQRVEMIEALAERPRGANNKAAPIEQWEAEDGTRFPILRKGADFKSLYRPANDEEAKVTLGDFLRAVAGMRCSEIAKKSLSEGTDSAGGFAVPTILMPQILEALVPASSLLQAGAGIVDMSGGAAKSFSTAAISAIPTAAWRAENAAVAESEPTFRLVPAAPKSLAFYFKASREVLADALNFEAALRIAITMAFAKELDRVGLRGTGTAPEPRGILNTSGIQSVTNGANGASLATTAYANFISALQALLAADAPMPTAFIMAPRSLTTLAGLLDSTNQPRQAPPAIARIPFLSTSQIPVNLTVGTSTDCSEIYTGDFPRVVFVMRERPSIMIAKEVFATTGQVAFICHVRADVAVQYPAVFCAITGVRA